MDVGDAVTFEEGRQRHPDQPDALCGTAMDFVAICRSDLMLRSPDAEPLSEIFRTI